MTYPATATVKVTTNGGIEKCILLLLLLNAGLLCVEWDIKLYSLTHSHPI